MPDTESLLATAIGYSLPSPIFDPHLEVSVRDAVAAVDQTVVALDDDPTGFRPYTLPRYWLTGAANPCPRN